MLEHFGAWQTQKEEYGTVTKRKYGILTKELQNLPWKKKEKKTERNGGPMFRREIPALMYCLGERSARHTIRWAILTQMQ